MKTLCNVSLSFKLKMLRFFVISSWFCIQQLAEICLILQAFYFWLFSIPHGCNVIEILTEDAASIQVLWCKQIRWTNDT
jgi:hypothetical protein